MEKNYKRRTYYIKNSVQSKFIFRFVAISLVGGIAAVTAFNFLAYKKIDSVLYSMRLPNISPGGLLWNEMIYTNVFVVLFILVVFAFTARSLFNKVHGPLKKLTNDIKRMEEGDLSQEISLRQNDEFTDFAGDLNTMAKELNQQFSEIRSANDTILANASKIDQSDNKEALLAAITNSLITLQKAIGSFKV